MKNDAISITGFDKLYVGIKLFTMERIVSVEVIATSNVTILRSREGTFRLYNFVPCMVSCTHETLLATRLSTLVELAASLTEESRIES
jgi:hypothetical protein